MHFNYDNIVCKIQFCWITSHQWVHTCVFVFKCLEHTHTCKIVWLVFLSFCCCWSIHSKNNCYSPQPRRNYIYRGVHDSTFCVVVCIQRNVHAFILFIYVQQFDVVKKWMIGQVRGCIRERWSFDQHQNSYKKYNNRTLKIYWITPVNETPI